MHAGILELVLDDVITFNYAFCNLIRALKSGSCDKNSCSEPDPLSRWEGPGTRLPVLPTLVPRLTNPKREHGILELAPWKLR